MFQPIARTLSSTLLLATMLLPLPAGAADGANTYSAQLASAPAEGRFIAGGLLWRCDGATCRAPANGSRPPAVCRQVSMSEGQVTRFASAKGEFTAEDLARCNRD